ncbi:hydrolase [Pseudonocardiaceae bacterium YIM PH 21723]|nr:hydrolase [Pseudonocardiaceae bacterium YIM PH 21723]
MLDRGEVGFEERGDLGPHSTSWATPEELAAVPHILQYRDHGRGVYSFRRDPGIAIGQWTYVVRTPHGNLMWDPQPTVDDHAAGLVRDLGGVHAITASHAHMFGAQISWSHRFGGIPVLVNEHNREWLPRTDPVVEYWRDHAEPIPGIELIQLGGHMLGSGVARTPEGDLLCGDTITGSLEPGWVSFRRSWVKQIPLSANVVRRLVTTLDGYRYDRLMLLNGDVIGPGAEAMVRRSAEAHIRWSSGEFDELT